MINSFIIILPIILFISYILIKDTMDNIENNKTQLSNLLSEKIVINITKQEKDMLNELMKVNRSKSENSYLRKKIKETINQEIS